MIKNRPKFSQGYKRYNLPDYCKEQFKYGDCTKISKANNIHSSSVSYAFSSGWATFEIINAIKNYYGTERGILQVR